MVPAVAFCAIVVNVSPAATMVAKSTTISAPIDRVMVNEVPATDAPVMTPSPEAAMAVNNSANTSSTLFAVKFPPVSNTLILEAKPATVITVFAPFSSL